MSYKEVAWFNSRLEAETVGHALDAHQIPFMVQSGDVGMFGPGMIGRSPVGASLLVPENRLGEVRQLLECVVQIDENVEPRLEPERELDGGSTSESSD